MLLSRQEGPRHSPTPQSRPHPVAYRHYMFEHRPFTLFLLHSGYHLMTLVLMCTLLAMFGTQGMQ